MKKLFAFVVIVLLVVVAIANVVTAVNDHYDRQNKNNNTQIETIPKSESDKKIEEVTSAAATDYKALVDRFNLQTTECEKGKVAYDKLTPLAKTQTPAPTCAPAVAD